MPILTLQQRQRELGRIRIGQKVGAKGRPEKLDRFRFTSPSKALIDSVAAAYGGTVQAWDGAGTDQWEVITEAKRLPILVPPQPVSQFFELWSGGGCQRRCDGVTELLTDAACICGPDPEERACKPTTRLNVVLRDVHGVGVWRLESHGYYSAVELPQTAAFLASATGQGVYLPAHLALEERVVKRAGQQPNRFVVPTIEVDVTPAELMSGGAGAVAIGGDQVAAIQQQGAAAIEAAPARSDSDWLALVQGATTVDEIRELWRQAKAELMSGGAGAVAIGGDQVAAIQQQGAAAIEAAPGRSDSDWLALVQGATTVDEIRELWRQAKAEGALAPAVEQAMLAKSTDLAGRDARAADVPADPDVLWQQIVAACPVGWTLDDLETDFEVWTSGTAPGAADPEQLQGYLTKLTGAAV